MKIQKSAEDYLETILMLKKRIGQVRSIDIVNETGYSKPSISIAMKRLRENGYIYMDANGYITLADTGLKIAKQMYERHQLLTEFLILYRTFSRCSRQTSLYCLFSRGIDL